MKEKLLINNLLIALEEITIREYIQIGDYIDCINELLSKSSVYVE